MTNSGGTKHDAGKADLSLIPLAALQEEAAGFTFGAAKYGLHNYKQGLEATRLLSAALRHIYAVLQGEDSDPESGAHHLGHARCCLAMYLECLRLGTLQDNRYKRDPTETEIPTPLISRTGRYEVQPDGTLAYRTLPHTHPNGVHTNGTLTPVSVSGPDFATTIPPAVPASAARK